MASSLHTFLLRCCEKSRYDCISGNTSTAAAEPTCEVGALEPHPFSHSEIVIVKKTAGRQSYNRPFSTTLTSIKKSSYAFFVASTLSSILTCNAALLLPVVPYMLASHSSSISNSIANFF